MEHEFSILIVDDEAPARYSVRRALARENYALFEAASGEEALAHLDDAGNAPVDLVLLDLSMPGMDGMETLSRIRTMASPPEVIMITAHGSERLAVEAIRRGALDYIAKPYEIDELLAAIRNVMERIRLLRENKRLRDELARSNGERVMLGESPAMHKLFERIDTVAQVNVTVLVRGESGTGKELIARAIHERSGRNDGPFIAVNAAAIPEGLVESELFGHERGAFTGAEKRRIGRFEQASGGTIFLDEIGDMPLAAQSKILRLLEERTFERLGGRKSIETDLRLVTATNRDLKELMRQGKFREDLFYRIKVVELTAPPLRERATDIPLLAGAFCQASAEQHEKQVIGFTEAASRALIAHSWPGNVRELKNAIETGVVLASGERIDICDLPLELNQGGVPEGLTLPKERMPLREATKQATESFERAYISEVLKETNGNISAAARTLGVHRQSLQNKMRTLLLSAEDFREDD